MTNDHHSDDGMINSPITHLLGQVTHIYNSSLLSFWKNLGTLEDMTGHHVMKFMKLCIDMTINQC